MHSNPYELVRTLLQYGSKRAYVGYDESYNIDKINIEDFTASQLDDMRFAVFGTLDSEVRKKANDSSCFGGEYCFIEKKYFDAIQHIYDGGVFVLKVGMQMIGFVNVKHSEGTVRINALCIKSNHRKHGYGKLLMQHILDAYATNNFYLTILCDDDKDKRAKFYNSLGFKCINKIGNFEEWTLKHPSSN